jgi:small subunit ribosomal protein S9
MAESVHTSGKRKTAKARASVTEGDGTLRINSRPVHIWADHTVDAEGGGKQGQTEAIRMAIARGLVEYTGSDKLERDFRDYDRNMMVEDPRRTETRKPSQSSKGARHKQQKSYR